MSKSYETRRAIAQTFKSLVLEVPFKRITVSLVCHTAGISRRSYYNHFKDLYNLINWIYYDEFLHK